ncbi:HP1 family phage holin [Pantoea phytobeneficialis]|uniref:HP1 family phage holin n=1 Tax=Pantoea phytobeneficialis TaxID=2052056 RepID=A0ABT8XZ19_9GAMM|nr:HP1 family phage holin [Pantoea phytobeneficialis]MDO6408673.1 HP1 family phage holin [Pantoea phytobeneficialis]
MSLERISTFITYCVAAVLGWLGKWNLQDMATLLGMVLGWLGKWNLQDMATLLGMVLGVGMFLVSWYYRRKTYQLLASGRISRRDYESANR